MSCYQITQDGRNGTAYAKAVSTVNMPDKWAITRKLAQVTTNDGRNQTVTPKGEIPCLGTDFK